MDRPETQLAQLARWIAEARSFVVFTGAGISTESGIPDFRSPGGVWARSQPVYFEDFLRSADARREYWRQKAESHGDMVAARPNVAHDVLAAWEAAGRLRGVMTQNIDGLHQLAGSRRVLELHGTARHAACLKCAARYDVDPLVREFLESGEPPPCPACGGLLKHATVSFGQMLPQDVLREASRWAAEADLFLAIGSSLVVTPAAELPAMAHDNGARLVIVNRDPTPLDHLAALVINSGIGETFSQVAAAMT